MMGWITLIQPNLCTWITLKNKARLVWRDSQEQRQILQINLCLFVFYSMSNRIKESKAKATFCV